MGRNSHNKHGKKRVTLEARVKPSCRATSAFELMDWMEEPVMMDINNPTRKTDDLIVPITFEEVKMFFERGPSSDFDNAKVACLSCVLDGRKIVVTWQRCTRNNTDRHQTSGNGGTFNVHAEELGETIQKVSVALEQIPSMINDSFKKMKAKVVYGFFATDVTQGVAPLAVKVDVGRLSNFEPLWRSNE